MGNGRFIPPGTPGLCGPAPLGVRPCMREIRKIARRSGRSGGSDRGRAITRATLGTPVIIEEAERVVSEEKSDSSCVAGESSPPYLSFFV